MNKMSNQTERKDEEQEKPESEYGIREILHFAFQFSPRPIYSGELIGRDAQKRGKPPSGKPRSPNKL